MVEFYCRQCRETFETNRLLVVCPECRSVSVDWFEEEETEESYAQVQ